MGAVNFPLRNRGIIIPRTLLSRLILFGPVIVAGLYVDSDEYTEPVAEAGERATGIVTFGNTKDGWMDQAVVGNGMS